MSRITRRIAGSRSIEFVDGQGYANLSHEESVRLLFEKLADCEDRLEKSNDLKRAYFELENWLYGAGKNKPLEIQSAMLWGGLFVMQKSGNFDWNEMRNLFGEFMSKKMNLR